LSPLEADWNVADQCATPTLPCTAMTSDLKSTDRWSAVTSVQYLRIAPRPFIGAWNGVSR
jgi:hypothetical protein